MPTKDIIAEENTATPALSISSGSSGMVPRDVDDLVKEIKLNLRLKGNCNSTNCEGETERTPESHNNNNGFGAGGASGSVLVTCSGRTKIRALNHRISPYFVPPRSGGDSGCHGCGSPRCYRMCLHQRRTDSSDPYQVLQELLKEGGLIKEAVRRISKTEDTILKCYDYEKDDYDMAATTTSSNLIGLEA